jgi:hypothetical protein
LSIPENRQRLLQDIYSFIEIWLALQAGQNAYQDIRNLSLLATKSEKETIVKASNDYQSLVHSLYAAYAKLKGMKNYGDKYASSGRLHIDDLADSIPNIKIIHIVRDIRDIHLSMKFWWSPKSVASSAVFWKQQIQICRNWGERNPDSYLLVRYEDLTTDPEETTKRISDFLNMPILADPQATSKSELAKVASLQESHSLMTGKIVPNSEKWRANMNPDDIAMAESITEDILIKYGYELSDTPRPGNLSLLRFITQTKDTLSFSGLMLRTPAIAPPIIWGISRLGIPIDTVMIKPLRKIFERICQS